MPHRWSHGHQVKIWWWDPRETEGIFVGATEHLFFFYSVFKTSAKILGRSDDGDEKQSRELLEDYSNDLVFGFESFVLIRPLRLAININ